MNGNQAADRIEKIRDEIQTLVNEARELDRKFSPSSSFICHCFYVYKQIEEHLEKMNPHNKDMNDIANIIRINSNA